MDIALVGAPGSGKTDFALKLRSAVPSIEQTKCHIVDHYADEMAELSGLALGDAAGYIGNFLVAADRLKHELYCMKNDKIEHAIVCGTLIETVTYMSVHAAIYTGKKNREGHAKVATFMHLCGLLFQDMFVYDHVFYLPLPEVDPAELTEEVKLFDKELQRALEMFALPYARLDGPVEQQIEKALKTIETPATPE